MIDICTCCKGCSSGRQLSNSPRYSFPKKLLVAILIVVIIAMCLPPTEARGIENKRRHKRLDGMIQPTKETRITHEHRRRHHKVELTLTKEMMRRPKNSQSNIFNQETRKIVRKLKNTKRVLKDDRREEKNELREYRDSMPPWLPTVNFYDIQFHDYRSNRSRRNGTTIPERRFTYVIPKLYKSLVEYEEIFTRLLHVELNFPDDAYNTNKNKRKRIINNTLEKLKSTIQVVNDSMAAVKLALPAFNKNKLDLSSLELKVDATQCFKNDNRAFRGYSKLLENWYSHFICKSDKQATKPTCVKYMNKFKKRRNR